MRVIVLERDPLFRRFLHRALTAMGHGAVAAGDGRELLEAAAREKECIVLLDLYAPAGWEMDACARLREVRPDARVVALFGDADGARLAREAGAARKLSKPFDLQELRGALGAF